jgi:hypothetical protein
MTARPRIVGAHRRNGGGYGQPMAASRRPDEPTRAPNALETSGAGEGYDPIAEQHAARRARAERDRRLTSAERLQALHELCAQLASVTPPQPRDDR